VEYFRGKGRENAQGRKQSQLKIERWKKNQINEGCRAESFSLLTTKTTLMLKVVYLCGNAFSVPSGSE
jgi:hypothetical protein